MMTLAERCEAHNETFARWPASRLYMVSESGRDVVYGRWVVGNDYRNKSAYYGAYPAGYLGRVAALFPDVEPIVDGRLTTLHAFSGSLPAGPYARCDVRQEAECQCNVYDIDPAQAGTYDLVLADPPYQEQDAVKYGTEPVDRRRAIAALARVARHGAHMVWLDTCWPMHNKREWLTVGRIALTRSTNHRTRDVTIFQRQ